jgi:hypothetical protein
MKRLLIGWNAFRIIRLLIGIAALVQGIIQKEGLVLVAGSWILFGALFNRGCCGSGGCPVPMSKQSPGKEVGYEEVVASK